MKINWSIVGPMLAVLVWVGSMEYRLGKVNSTLDVSQRVKNIEDLMVPLLVEFKVQEALGKMQLPAHVEHTEPPVIDPPPILPYPQSQIREESQKWAEDRIKQYKR